MLCSSVVRRCCLFEQEACICSVHLQKQFLFGFALLLFIRLAELSASHSTYHVFNIQAALKRYSVYVLKVYNFLESNNNVLPWLLLTEVPLLARGLKCSLD